MLSVICRELDKTPNDFIETEQKSKLRFFKSLSFSEKWDYALEWSRENKLIGFLAFVFNMIACIGIGLTTYFAASQPYRNYPPFLLASVLSGAILLTVSGIILLIFTLSNNSKKFNLWLLQKKSIIRKRK